MADLKKGIKSFEDMFAPSEELNDKQSTETQPSVVAISKLKPFSRHPFKPYQEDKLKSLAQSIQEQGVIVPILIRPIKDDKYEYEIIAGHNRVQASRIARLDEIPCNIRELDDETSTIMMVDSNLEQRDSILPSEKAYAYWYKLEAIKSQGKRTDLTSSQLGTKSQRADEILAKDNEDSRNQIHRYIRLTQLIKSLLDKVDENKLNFISAVELSYLKKEEQQHLYDILNREENFGVSGDQAKKLKGISQNGDLTYEKIDKIITAKVKEKGQTYKVPYKKVQTYFPINTTPKEFEETLIKALEEYFSKEK